jgi:DNA-binding XRE family transcriptional regulator
MMQRIYILFRTYLRRRRKVMVPESFHERLERARREANLTATAMAQLIEVPESTYREWEKGRGMRMPPLQKISQVLAISVTELLIGEKPPWSAVVEQLTSIEKSISELNRSIRSRI